jgi:uncharacterized protein YdeI (YjbR/CyaY-like superfamily)
MKRYTTADEFYESQEKGQETLLKIREILLSTELEETIKWGAPCYTITNKNVIGIASFKEHMAVWFHQGVMLKDEKGKLVNAQEGKTKALRQWRIGYTETPDFKTLETYVYEAIDNQKNGRVLSPKKTLEVLDIPTLLSDEFSKNKDLEKHFKALSNYKQKEYCEHISSAKRETTKQKRLEKIIPMILENKGLHDKYKNC